MYVDLQTLKHVFFPAWELNGLCSHVDTFTHKNIHTFHIYINKNIHTFHIYINTNLCLYIYRLGTQGGEDPYDALS